MKSADLTAPVKSNVENLVRSSFSGTTASVLVWRVYDPVFASKHEVAGVAGQQITSQIYLNGR